MVERFFVDYKTDSRHHQSPLVTLLSGPPSCGKTSLLFQFALNATLSRVDGISNPTVVVMCYRQRMESKPPFLSQGIDSTLDIFHQIKMKYLDDFEGIMKYFAAFHLLKTFPVAVIIDDFGDFFDKRLCQVRYCNSRGRDLAMAKTLALCHNAVMHANGKGHTELLLSDTHHGNSPRFFFLYKRWIYSIYTIKGDGKGSFILSNYCFQNEDFRRLKMAKYSITLHHLILEGFIENEDNNSRGIAEETNS